MTYREKLGNAISSTGSHVVVGLDTDIEKIPAFFMKYENPVLEFNRAVIEATKSTAAGYKLNIAFYEFLEEKGLQAMRGSLEAIPESSVTICDAKRGDLGNTSEMYAATYFDKYGFDSVTVNAYMGKDAFEPFLRREGKLLYVLALTSNPSSSEFQLADAGGKKVYEILTEKVLTWDSDKIGFVFGANHTAEISRFTSANPGTPVLIPGIGAQGNELEPLLRSLNTEFFVINASRSIIYAAGKDCTAEEFHRAIEISLNDLNAQISGQRS